ncbi:MAG: class I SAM-dependent methyltransferase [Candidatus Omnitrophica bacterium]|nr:class I SAM-dependent methyltransferase [Candidatus Omnitrophota bacterium]
MSESFPPAANSLFNFGPLAETYENWYNTPAGREHDFMQQQDALELIRQASPSGLLLDVGCGSGHWSRFFQSAGYEVQGIDVSARMIREAMNTAPECKFSIGDACALPFQDASFVIAASMAALEFMAAPETAVREMARCVKPGGRLIIGTLNRLAPLNQDRLDSGKQPYASGRLFSPQELWDLISPYGKIRMVSSSVLESRETPSRFVQIHPPVPLRHLAGPFVIAEVRK